VTKAGRLLRWGVVLVALGVSPALFASPFVLGMAEVYPGSFSGKTASGESYSGSGRTTAMREIPLGASVRVTHLRSARAVVVRVNDRMPPASPAVVRLSRAAADALAFAEGTDREVLVTVLSRDELAAAVENEAREEPHPRRESGNAAGLPLGWSRKARSGVEPAARSTSKPRHGLFSARNRRETVKAVPLRPVSGAALPSRFEAEREVSRRQEPDPAVYVVHFATYGSASKVETAMQELENLGVSARVLVRGGTRAPQYQIVSHGLRARAAARRCRAATRSQNRRFRGAVVRQWNADPGEWEEQTGELR